MIRMELAARLKYFREKAGLTIYEVGEKIGKSGKTVSAWENGRGQPDADMLLTLCDVYGISSISELYGENFSHETQDTLTPHERIVLSAYRNNPNMQEAVDKLLGIEPDGAEIAEDMVETIKSFAKENTVIK